MAVETALATDFALLLITATLLAFFARKTNQPTIIAYIATGLVLGPVMLNVVTESQLIELMSELGLGFLLFLLGIEMNLEEIKEILRPVTNIAILQTILQTSLAFIVPLVLGFTMIETIVIALCTVFGATPVIVKLLTDKDEITSLPGKIDVGVLILQDIYLVIILALFSAGTLTDPQVVGTTLVKIFVMMSLIGGLTFLLSRYVLPDLFKKVAESQHAFFIHGIALAFVFISLSLYLDLSVEVGAFLAGLGLGQIPYREELKERIRPLTDFFMVIFFSSIGLQLTTSNLFTYWKEAVFASAVLMIGNFIIMFYLIDREKFTPKTSFLGSINMTQVSEFSLVVGALAVTQGFVGNDILGYLSLMALLTMSTSSYLINYNQQIYQRARPYLERFESEDKQDVELKEFEDHAVVVGYDELTRDAIPLLRREFGTVVVVDDDPRKSDDLSERNIEYIYGDFMHGEIRKSAALKNASIVVSAAPSFELNQKILQDKQRDATAFVKAKNFEDAAKLYETGAHYVMMKNVLSGDRLSDYLELLIKDSELFREEVRGELERIHWRDKK